MTNNHKAYVCRCEEVTREEIAEAIKNGATSMNEIKKWTRAGMGLCQGKMCSKNASKILAELTNAKPEDVLPASVRQPIRPVRIEIISND
ncbi:MAG: (2Fe-2S)-binding protein [Peptococcaceae bacterium]